MNHLSTSNRENALRPLQPVGSFAFEWQAHSLARFIGSEFEWLFKESSFETVIDWARFLTAIYWRGRKLRLKSNGTYRSRLVVSYPVIMENQVKDWLSFRTNSKGICDRWDRQWAAVAAELRMEHEIPVD